MDTDPNKLTYYIDEIAAVAKKAAARNESKEFAIAASRVLQAETADRKDIPHGRHIELIMRAVIAALEDDKGDREYIESKLNLGYHGLRRAFGILPKKN